MNSTEMIYTSFLSAFQKFPANDDALVFFFSG